MVRSRLSGPWLLATFLLLVASAPAWADIRLTIEQPSADSTRSGIGLISGWAISDQGISSVEAFIDGDSLGEMPYGSARADVAGAFPGIPGAQLSGWAMLWNFAILDAGEHLLTVVATAEDGSYLSRDLVFNVTAFDAEFIADPEDVLTTGAQVTSPEDGRLRVSGATVEGREVDFELAWDTASQQFLIDSVTYREAERQLQAPTASAGSNRTVLFGADVSIAGSGSDPDGFIRSHDWAQVSGPLVDLVGADQWTVRFTAPNSTGQVRLRLVVTDDDGLSDSDDVYVTIEEPPPPPNQAPTANAGADRNVEQGASVVLTGSGSDNDGQIVSWRWTQLSGASVTLAGASTPEVSFTAPDAAGDIRLRLTVTDDDGASDSDDVTVTVEETSGGGSTTGSTLQSMLTHVNDARSVARECGNDHFDAQPPLQWSASLADIARQHSMEMAGMGYFSHTSADGTSMADRVFPYWSGTRVGENIAASSIDRSDEYVIQLWLDSPGHCALIMSPDFTHAGVGSGHDTDNGYEFRHFWTLDFGG